VIQRVYNGNAAQSVVTVLVMKTAFPSRLIKGGNSKYQQNAETGTAARTQLTTRYDTDVSTAALQWTKTF